MGIDYGDARVGIAISDELGLTAQGLITLNESNAKNVVDKIIEIAQKYQIKKIIFGYPKNMDGSIGERAKITDKFISKLASKTNYEIVKWDERLTTVQAINVLNETNVRGKKRKNVLDIVAATFILQSYLDSC